MNTSSTCDPNMLAYSYEVVTINRELSRHSQEENMEFAQILTTHTIDCPVNYWINGKRYANSKSKTLHFLQHLRDQWQWLASPTPASVCKCLFTTRNKRYLLCLNRIRELLLKNFAFILIYACVPAATSASNAGEILFFDTTSNWGIFLTRCGMDVQVKS